MQITDAFKYPLEKLVYFAASLIPGFAALLIYWSDTSTRLDGFIRLPLGYATKIWLVVLAAFVVGQTITGVLRAVADDLGFWIGKTIATVIPTKFSFEHESAPWRDAEWRTAVKRRLGDAAPRDSELLTIPMYRLKLELAGFLSDQEKAAEGMKLFRQRAETVIDDMKWQGVYRHYHQRLLQPDAEDISLHIRSGLTYNFLAAAGYLLIAACFVPSVRHWWCVAPACAWVFIVVAETVGQYARLNTLWTTLQEQITYLSNGQL